jgi:lipoic acid synthetase
VTHGTPGPLNRNEPRDIAESVKTLGLKYVVVTSVTRDDLKDGGASVFFETVQEIRRVNYACKIELLIPDFRGDETAIQKVIDAAPDVMNHNIEVVESLFAHIRPQGNYRRSLEVLKTIKTKERRIPTKSGFMVGLGETTEQILTTMHDLRDADVDFLTIGQYLQPTQNHALVKKYYPPEEFLELKNAALQLGFLHVESGPLVRSSYHAQTVLQ